jgi:hypothetical protein
LPTKIFSPVSVTLPSDAAIMLRLFPTHSRGLVRNHTASCNAIKSVQSASPCRAAERPNAFCSSKVGARGIGRDEFERIRCLLLHCCNTCEPIGDGNRFQKWGSLVIRFLEAQDVFGWRRPGI